MIQPGGLAAFGKRQDALADTDFIARLDEHFGDRAGSGRRNGCDSFFVFQFEKRLFVGNLVAFFDEQVHDCSRIGALAEMWKFYIHN